MENSLIENKCPKREESKLVKDVKEISLATQIPFSMDSRKGFYYKCYNSNQVSIVTGEILNKGYDFRREFNQGKFLIYLSEYKGEIGKN